MDLDLAATGVDTSEAQIEIVIEKLSDLVAANDIAAS